MFKEISRLLALARTMHAWASLYAAAVHNIDAYSHKSDEEPGDSRDLNDAYTVVFNVLTSASMEADLPADLARGYASSARQTLWGGTDPEALDVL